MKYVFYETLDSSFKFQLTWDQRYGKKKSNESKDWYVYIFKVYLYFDWLSVSQSFDKKQFLSLVQISTSWWRTSLMSDSWVLKWIYTAVGASQLGQGEESYQKNPTKTQLICLQSFIEKQNICSELLEFWSLLMQSLKIIYMLSKVILLKFKC